jgi:hypothetical protein
MAQIDEMQPQQRAEQRVGDEKERVLHVELLNGSLQASARDPSSSWTASSPCASVFIAANTASLSVRERAHRDRHDEGDGLWHRRVLFVHLARGDGLYPLLAAPSVSAFDSP